MMDVEDSDTLIIQPLGAGQEVGRSCILLTFKGKKILMDCGIHPGLQGVDALPFVDLIDCEEVDLLLVTHFHLDHCGALPWFLEKTTFKGRCFMTHATKAIYRMLVGDYVKIAQMAAFSSDRMLFTEEDLEKSMDKIEVVDFHEQKEVNGIRFWCYVAGHVLGAAMFMLEIAGVRVLYTGDFSRVEDRHLCAAEIPHVRPDVLITESTYGTQIHEKQEERERRFTKIVEDIVSRGGRCLIPVFALGRAQELLLILDEFWERSPHLQEVPIYYASSLAKKCMSVYQTFVSGMNERIRKQIAISNPFVFKHISNLKSIDHFEDVGPCVVLASPGMLQSGLSRDLFESWCPYPKNGCIIAGYCCEGTLAKHILSEPEEIMTINGQKLPLRMQIAYISFSAHTDYQQTSEFIRELKAPNVILVHGEMNEMNRLKAAIIREYEDDPDIHIEVYNPRNTQEIELKFRGEKTAKIVGKLAMNPPKDGQIVSGVLVKRNFNYHLMDPSDLSAYTDFSQSVLTQKQSVFYSGTFPLLHHYLKQIAGDVILADKSDFPKDLRLQSDQKKILKLFGGKLLLHFDQPVIILEWAANPVSDMYADAALAAILQAENNPVPQKNVPAIEDHDQSEHFSRCLVQALDDIYGEGSCKLIYEATISDENEGEEEVTSTTNKPCQLMLTVDGKEVKIDLESLEISCQDEATHHFLTTTLNKLKQVLSPVVS